jgi:hypothetical protein
MRLPEHVYHLAEEANWPSIQQHGMLPADVLIRRALSAEPARSALMRAQRLKHTVLPSGVHIRDQKPMPARALASCLVGLTTSEWYALINAHIFFWLEPERLNRQRAACGLQPQVVAVVRTADLLEHCADTIFVTPFNTGYALRKPARRSEATLVSYKVWSSSGWQTETQAAGCKPRSSSHRPAELLVRGPIRRFERFVQSVIKLPPGKTFSPNVA